MPPTDHQVAIDAAAAGAAVVAAMSGRELERFAKGPGDFATEADIAAEKAIFEVIRRVRPGDALLGEETGGQGGSEHEADGVPGRVWLVDPLCGTLNYATGGRLVAVNVALQAHGQTVAAAVADPFTGEVFWTDGVQSYLRRGGSDQLLAPRVVAPIVDVNLDPPFGKAARLVSERGFLERFRPRVVSTTLAATWVAAGRRVAYVTDGDLRGSVHFTAAIAICRNAGCVFTGIDGQPLHTGNGGLLAAVDQETHAALLEMLSRC
jgi:myo-inositol-1(or 4)-monophosphatase